MAERLVTLNVNGVTIVRFKDKRIVDAGNIEQMGDEMLQLVNAQHLKQILLNFEGVEFLSSAAFNKLIELNKAVKDSKFLESFASDAFSIGTSAIGVIFQLFTIALFTFYLVADAPKLRRTLLRRLPKEKQKREKDS